MAKTTVQIRPEVEAYVREHYTTAEDISCARCGRDDGECRIYFGPTFRGTLQGRRPNYDPMCWADAVEFEMNVRADSGEWDPDLEDEDENGPQHDPTCGVHCECALVDGRDEAEIAAELLQGEPPASGRWHWGQDDISYCDECGNSNWYDEDQTTCPRCEGLGLANRAAWQRYDAMIARGYR